MEGVGREGKQRMQNSVKRGEKVYSRNKGREEKGNKLRG